VFASRGAGDDRRTLAVSREGEYVAAASSNKAEHSIHVWSRSSGTLEKILEGPPEGILDVRPPYSPPCRLPPLRTRESGPMACRLHT
jgi:hypothetical protein